MADVAADINAEVSTDGAWVRVKRFSGAKHLSASSNSVVSLPDHGANWTGIHVFDEASEESLLGEVSVVLFEVSFAGLADLHGNQLEASLFKALNDGADETTLDTIRLNHNEGALL